VKYIEGFDHNPTSKWFKNNVCLLGDAAHAALPTSGQGACQAIEDAWHFSTSLAQFKTVDEAFQEFQKIRHEKTTSIIMAGRGLANSLFNSDPDFCHRRNQNARKADYVQASMGMANLWGKQLPA
jgi:2-polyprenyl-6-methoxyphenol hydroxylase-like FAD-dependent oxidoreductase